MSEGQPPLPPPSQPRGRTHHSSTHLKESHRAPGNSYRPRKRNEPRPHQNQQAEWHTTSSDATSLATAPAPTSTRFLPSTQAIKHQNWDEMSDDDNEEIQLPVHGPSHSITKQNEDSATSPLPRLAREATRASPQMSTKDMPRATNRMHRSQGDSTLRQAQTRSSLPHNPLSTSDEVIERDESNLELPLDSTAATSPVDNDISSIVVSPPKSRANRPLAEMPTSTTGPQFINPSASKAIESSRLFDQSMHKAINQRPQTTPPIGPQATTAQQSHRIPTWTAPPLSRRQGERDPNRVEVTRARPWGRAPLAEEAERFEDAPVSEQRAEEPPNETTAVGSQPMENPWDEDPVTGDWNKNVELQQWAQAIPPSAAPVPDQDLGLQPQHSGPHENEILSRPSSIPLQPAPQTIFYSDEEVSPTPALTHRGESPVDVDEVAVAASRTKLTEVNRKVEKSPTIISVTVGSTGELAETASVADQLDPAPRRRRDSRQQENNPMWWKRSPHPMYSPRFAARRLLVEFPFPIRISHVRNLLIEHFSKYGPVRATFHYEPVGDSCEKGFVVFHDVESVGACLEDRQVNTCFFRSGPNAALREFNLVIKQTKAEALCKTVFVRVASKTSLPPKLFIDAVPKMNRVNMRITWFAHVRPIGASLHQLREICKARTGKAPKEVGIIDMSVSEMEFMPILCNYFAEICNIVPPTAVEEGWLITVGAPNDGRNLMEELNRVPGIFTRWATEMDGVYPTDGPESIPDITSNPRSPLTQLKRELNGLPSQSPFALPSSLPAENHGPERLDSTVDGEPTFSTTVKGRPDFGHRMPEQTSAAPDGSYSPTHPGLRRQVMYVSRGRLLTEDVNGHFYDERAVFIGRLDKRETDVTLHRRFSKYGRVYKIESNAHHKASSFPSGYTSARILYHTKEAAQLAIANENGKESFGSYIRVELRRVLPMDVTMKEMYLTDSGMAVSPSMVSQSSPTPSNRQSPVTAPVAPPPLPFSIPTQPPMRAMFPFMQYSIPLPVQNCGQQDILNSHPAPQPPAGATAVPTMPPQFAPYMQMPYPPPPPSALGPTPSSQNYPLPFFCATLGMGYTMDLPPYVSTGPAPPNPTPPLSPQHQASAAAHSSSIPVGASIPPPAPLSPTTELPRDASSHSSRLRPLEFREVGGMMKAIYDPEELRQYCSEIGIAMPKGMTPPSSEEGREVSASTSRSHSSAGEQSALTSGSDGPTAVPLSIKVTRQRSASDTSLPSARSRQHQAPSPDSYPISQDMSSWREQQQSTVQAHHSQVRLVPVPVPVSMPLSPPPTAPADLQPLLTTQPLGQPQLRMDMMHESHLQGANTPYSTQIPATSHHQARLPSAPYHPTPIGSMVPTPSAPQSEPRSQPSTRDSPSSRSQHLPARPSAAPSITSSYHRRDSIIPPNDAHPRRAAAPDTRYQSSHAPIPQEYTHQQYQRPEQQPHHRDMLNRASQQPLRIHQNMAFALHQQQQNQQRQQHRDVANSGGQSGHRPPRAHRPDPLGRDIPLSNSPPNPDHGGW